MVGTSKILTVSYGTFSCTLEGFDDPFAAMKLIAEYFRDLAANDRYFGAEPPQPDMTQLAAIAQRTTSAPVGAAVDERGVHLTQTPDVVEEVVAGQDVPTADGMDFAVGDEAVSAEDGNAVLGELDEPVAEGDAEFVADEPVTAEAEDEIADAEDRAPEEAPAVEAAPPEPDAPEAVAARVEDTPAGEVEPVTREPVPEDVEQEFAVPVGETAIPEAKAQDTAMPDAEADLPEPDEDRATLAEDPDLPGEPGDATGTEPGRDNVFETDATETETAEPADLPLSERRADGAARAEARRRGLALSLTDDELAEAATHSVTPKSRPEAFEPQYQTDEASSLSAEDEADLLAELAAAEAEDMAGEAPAPAPAEPAERIDLLAEDEGEREGEREGETAGADVSREGRAILESDLIEREEAAIDRLLAKTNTKLGESASQQSRDQFSHLKAAVAATMADRAESGESGSGDGSGDSAYRDDLAKVVKPTPDPEKAAKPAPLVLVADQSRSDEGKPRIRHAGGGVNPRRIRRDGTTETAREARARFADYAEKVGAYELTDLLEAAGAFLNTVEGKPDFTRPQIMHMVLHQDRDNKFTREDSLRGFENLLRKGAIQKVDRGKFAIGSESRFVS